MRGMGSQAAPMIPMLPMILIEIKPLQANRRELSSCDMVGEGANYVEPTESGDPFQHRCRVTGTQDKIPILFGFFNHVMFDMVKIVLIFSSVLP